MEPIRVLQCFTILNRGGAETMIMNHYRHIDKSKVQFDFLVHREEIGVYEKEIKELGGRIYRLPSIHPLNFFKYKREVKKFLSKHPDYKIIHGHFSELGYWLYKQSYSQGVPNIIVHAHNYPNKIDKKSIFRFFLKHKMRKYVNYYFSCSDYASKWLYGEHPKYNVIKMNNAVDIDKFSYNLSIAQRVRQEYNLNDKFVVGHIGRFNYQKNHNFLLDVFNEIKKKKENAILILIGEGLLHTKIKEKVNKLGLEESVLILGGKDNVNEIIQSFDLFLFPSLYEGLPLVLVEAQANGLICITSDTVTRQVDLTGNVKFINLNKTANEWADEIMDLNLQRRNKLDQIKEQGYDVKLKAKWLEGFYITLNNKN